MWLADGTRGRPGMVMTSPQMTTMNSAPAESRSSRIGTTWFDGAPRSFGSVESERLGDWELRAASGFTRRANSVLPLGDPRLPLDEALDAVRRWYGDRGLPAGVVAERAFTSRPTLQRVEVNRVASAFEHSDLTRALSL